MVRAAKQSNRVPRWVRRALPRDPSPRMAAAVVGSAVAVPVILVAAVAVAATGGGSPSGAAGAGCTFVVDHTVTCSSTNPKVAVDGFFVGNTSACTFVRDITWGDGTSSDNVDIPGSPTPGAHYEDSHTYSAPGTYSIYFGGHAEGGCTISTPTYHFTLLPS